MSTEQHKHQLDIARAQGSAYVWGRQDAGESPRDTGYSIDFANWYADRKRAYLEEQTGFLPSLQDCYAEWQEIRQPAEALPTSAAEEQSS
jgi:hypothetical protein